jgi:antitoxin (DNA-binding transcriptional repressor) of toxin-antitoxin stability system
VYTKWPIVNPSSISVILPFRDAATTIDAALSGLLAQADAGREVIATDSGALRVRTWAARDPRVRLLHNHGRGLISALNMGIAAGSGALFARMDADDISHPERLTRQREYLLTHPEVDVLGCQVRAFVDEGASAPGEGLVRYVDWQNALLTPQQHAHAQFIESPLCHPSIIVRRTLLERIGGYREQGGPEDYELFLRALAHGARLAKLPEVLLAWRHHSARATFRDARYDLAGFRAVKAPYLARVIAQAGRARLVIWGAGATGKRLARALRGHGARSELFIDIDPRKLGQTAQGAPVADVEALDPARDLVIVAVATRGARALIAPQLSARGFVDGETTWFAS